MTSDVDGAEALRLVNIQGLGRTFVASRNIAPGELLLRERPHLVASDLTTLPSSLRRAYERGADELSMDIDDLLIVHAFCRAPESVRTTALTECCGAEACCSAKHDIVGTARTVAEWCRSHDDKCSQLPMADMEHQGYQEVHLFR